MTDYYQLLENTYKENRRGFLARAKKFTQNILDAEDALQETFVKALTHIDWLMKVENLPGWLFSILRNLLLDLWRRNQTHEQAGEIDISEETIAEIVASTGLNPSDELVRNALVEALSEAISSLPKKQREVIELQVIDNMTFKEIAEATGVPANTLMTRKRLAIKKLAVALRDWILDE